MASGALFQYPGSKGHLAPRIVSLLPVHRTYVEPFAGTLSVLLAKSPSACEVVNDIDRKLVTFYRVLRDDPDELVRRCELTPYAEVELDATMSLDEPDDEIEVARRFWLSRDMSINGKGRTFNFANMTTARAHIARMKEVANRLADAVILCRDYYDVFEQFDAEDTLFYCDPPYLGSTRTSGVYEHELRGLDEHQQFADVVNSARGMVLVSGYPSAEYDEMFPSDRWRYIDFEVTSTVSVAGNGRGKAATERLWANFPLAEQQRMFA